MRQLSFFIWLKQLQLYNSNLPNGIDFYHGKHNLCRLYNYFYEKTVQISARELWLSKSNLYFIQPFCSDIISVLKTPFSYKSNSPLSCSIFSSILNIGNFYIFYKILSDRRTNNFITKHLKFRTISLNVIF